MGLNAQTAVPVFTAGQILTAEQVTQINTGIPVFATTTTRDAAFGGAGEKVLAQGQYAYIEASSTLQVYTGSAWITVGATPGLVPCVPTSVTVGSGSATTSTNGQVTFTGVSSVALNGVFTSTYDNYRILFRPTVASTTQNITARLRVGGVDNSGAGTYRETAIYNNTSTTVASATGTGTLWYFNQQTSGTYQEQATYVADLFGPAIAATTIGMTHETNTTTTPLYQVYITSIMHTVATAYDGISLIASAGTMGGTISVYGYTK